MAGFSMSGQAIRGTVVLALVLAACGGGGEGTDVTDVTGTIQSPSTTQTPATDAPQTTSDAEETSDTHPQADKSMATVTIEGETYEFAAVDGAHGLCNPDFLGVGFRADLTHVEDGDPVEMSGFTELLTIILSLDGSGEGTVAGRFGGTGWSTLPEDGGSLDSFVIDGNRAEGSVTFGNVESSETAEGTFQVVCVEGR